MTAGPSEAGSVPGPKVFITYRREETAAHAGRLYDAMVARFGERNVFMDVDMAPGIDFVERITEAVAACQVLIVVMGPRWATVEDEHGKARIADPEDFVRLEVETGLRRPDVTPIPVLVSGARMPKRKDLPPEMQGLYFYAPRDLDFYTLLAALRHGIVMFRITRRMAHFGEVTLPLDVDDMIAHRAMLERMLAGAYWK